MSRGLLSIKRYGADLVFLFLFLFLLFAPWILCSFATKWALRPFGDVYTVPANGRSRAHEFYCEWQITLDPRREPHVNVPEVVRDEISTPQGHEED